MTLIQFLAFLVAPAALGAAPAPAPAPAPGPSHAEPANEDNDGQFSLE